MSDASESSTDPTVLKIREEAAEERNEIRALKVRVVDYLFNSTSRWHKERLVFILKRLRICGSSRGVGSRFSKDLADGKKGAWAKLLYFLGTRVSDPEIQNIYSELLVRSPFFRANLVATGFASSFAVEMKAGQLNGGGTLDVSPGKVLWVFKSNIRFEVIKGGLGEVSIVNVYSASGQ